MSSLHRINLAQNVMGVRYGNGRKSMSCPLVCAVTTKIHSFPKGSVCLFTVLFVAHALPPLTSVLPSYNDTFSFHFMAQERDFAFEECRKL